MSKHLLIMALAAMTFFSNCGSDDDEPGTDGGGNTISLGDLSRGQGGAIVSGNESFTIEGSVVGANLTATINGNSYNVNRVTIQTGQANDNRSVSLTFYIPTSLDQRIPPNGNITVGADDAALAQTYVSFFVVGEDDTYNSLSSTQGTVTVSNSSVTDNAFEVVFDVENLSSFDDTAVNVAGALKF